MQTEQISGYKTPWNGLGTSLWDGRGLGCASALGSALVPGLSFGCWGAVVEKQNLELLSSTRNQNGASGAMAV